MAIPQRCIPLPITNLPVNALTEDRDPTRELRTLIDQLQLSANESRACARTAQDERDELARQLDLASSQIEELHGKEASFRAQFVEISQLLRERDSALDDAETQRAASSGLKQELDAARRALDEERRQRLALSSHQADAAATAEHAITRFTELQKQVVSIRQARDSSQALNLDLASRLSQAEDALSELSYQRDLARNAQKDLSDEISDLRRELGNVTADRDATAQQVLDLNDQFEVERLRLIELSGRSNVPTENNTEATLALAETQRMLLTITDERDQLADRERQLSDEVAAQQKRFDELSQQFAEAEAQRNEAASTPAEAAPVDATVQAEIESLRTQIIDLTITAAQARAHAEETAKSAVQEKTLSARMERQRVETIDLGARLEAAQREILHLSASLAEARLSVKFAHSRAAKEAASAMRVPSLAGPDFSTPSFGDDDFPDSPPTDSLREPLSERDGRRTLAEIRACFQTFQKKPSDLSLLNEVYSHAYSFSERARVSGYVALHRLAAAFSHLTQDLYQFPETLTPSTMRTVGQAIDFLILLMKDRNVAQIKDPAKSLVYSVDDDAENCEAIKMALATSMLRTATAQEPAVALAEIADGNFDLIFLDVNLPDMDGFELCSQIRELPRYAKTPIVFVSGMTTLENRVQSSLSGASEFIGKPFNLHELNVKALTLLLKSQLQMD